MRTHHLKTWPSSFQGIHDGWKPFDIRKNDRDFIVGDRLWLYEWDPSQDGVSNTPRGTTCRAVSAIVSCVVTGWGLPPGLVVLGLKDVTPQPPSLLP